MKQRLLRVRIWPAALLAALTMLFGSGTHAQELVQVLRGYEIAPVPLNLQGKDWWLVGLGSYIVNTTGCNDCHTFPNWATGHNPYIGEPEQINTDRYLAGGRSFVPPGVVSANITPDKLGKPAGLSLPEFLKLMHTGHNPHDPDGVILQVMPWPLYRWKTDLELTAMYEYLRAIPSCQDTTPPDSANCKSKY